MFWRKAFYSSILALAAIFCFAIPIWAVDVSGIMPAAMGQPMINIGISLTPDGPPLWNPDGDPEWGLPYFNVNAYYDTGASGILLSLETAEYLGVQKSYYNDQVVIYEDVGVGGSEAFHVSEPVYISLAGVPSDDLDNFATYSTVYNQKFGPVRTQITTQRADLFAFDVVGIPAMAGKVVVMDPKPLDNIFSFDDVHTYVYNPGTPFRPATADTDPGIPTTGHHIRLSYASFDSFTQVTPAGAAGPTLAQNPFIGPNPVAALYGGPPDDTPGVTISLGGLKATGSFLFDTGAAASMISSSLAALIHVRYVNDTQSSGVLELFDPTRPEWSAPIPNQFTLELGGIGGSVTAAGFYLDSMLLRTLEGNPLNDLDPNHINFRNVPVLVSDITVQDPITLQTLTLDGIFGMNNLVAGMSPDMSNFGSGHFNWIVFDQPNGILGLDVKPPVASWTGAGTFLSTNWTNTFNWASGAPAAGYGLTFGETTPSDVANNNDFAAGTEFSGITFDGNTAFNLQGNRIALTGDVVNISLAAQTLSLDMTLTGQTRSFFADSANIIVNGHIDGNQGLVKIGASKLILKSSNAYTGQTIVNEGTLTLDGGDLADSSAISIANGALLEVLRGTPTLGPISGAGTLNVTGSTTSLTAPSIVVDTLNISSAPLAAVPEPSTLVLLGLSALSLILVRRFR